jgi:hypothetical protein
MPETLLIREVEVVFTPLSEKVHGIRLPNNEPLHPENFPAVGVVVIAEQDIMEPMDWSLFPGKH